MKSHRVECDEGSYPAQTLERFRHEVWMGKKSQTDEDASRQVKLSEKGEHKIEGDANKDVAIEGLWTVQNATQAPALVRGNGSKNEMHTGDFRPVVTQTMVFNLRQNDCWPQLNKAKVSEGIVRSHSHTPSGHHRLEIWELYPEKLSLIMDDLGIPRTSTSGMTTMGPNVNNTSDAMLRDTSADRL